MKTQQVCGKTPEEVCKELRIWYRGSAGQVLLATLRQQLQSVLPQLFGHYALQVGDVAPGQELLGASRIARRFVLDVEAAETNIRALAHALPIQADSVDLIVLVHALDFAQEPHEVLREVDRTLVPEGHVIVLGFNPRSLWGLWRTSLLWRKDRLPWCGGFYPPGRVKDWLSLLGFDTLWCRHLLFRPPLQRSAMMQKLEFMEELGRRFLPYLGGAYLILAQKRVVTLTRVRPRWRPRRAFVPANLAGPSTGSWLDWGNR
jgi:SAM-dependent methyltransferase